MNHRDDYARSLFATDSRGKETVAIHTDDRPTDEEFGAGKGTRKGAAALMK